MPNCRIAAAIEHSCAAIVGMAAKGTTSSVQWRVGQHVTTPNGFLAEIVSVREDRALIRYLTVPPGPGETELPLDLLHVATARHLVLFRIK
jgi:hypothetical protein